MNRFFALFLVLFLGAMMPALAQGPSTAEPSLPVEVKLLYFKLLNRTPDYDDIIRNNPTFKDNPARLNNPVVLDQQRNMLKGLYDKTGLNQKLVIRKKLNFVSVDLSRRTAITQPITIDDPVIYRFSDTEKYAIFIRNPKDIETLKPPFEFDDFAALNLISNYGADATMIVQPLAADPQDFTLKSGDVVHVILAKVTALSIDQPDGSKLILDKRFDGAGALPVPAAPTHPNALPTAAVPTNPVVPQPAAPAVPSAEETLPPAAEPVKK